MTDLNATHKEPEIPFLNLAHLHKPIVHELEAAALRVIRSGQYVGGEEVAQFEEELSQKLGGAHVIGVSSGTDALLVSLMAAGVGPGDEVITSSMTFFATAGCIARLGATPRFVDIDSRTFNLDVGAVKRAIGPKTKAVVPVHLFGQMCDMKALKTLCITHQLHLVADAAQSLGATHWGRPLGGHADVAAISFFPTKNLGALGDAGAVVTHDEALAKRIRVLCRHGSSPKYYHAVVGGNFRLDPIQAAMLRVKLPHLEAWNQTRRDNAARYIQGLKSTEGITLPWVAEGQHVTWHQFCVVVEKGRDRLQAFLKEHGIGTMVYYPRPLHEQACFEGLGYSPKDLPMAHQTSQKILALPIAPGITPAQIERVCQTIALWVELNA